MSVGAPNLMGLGLGRGLPNPRFPDPALHWMRQPLPNRSSAGLNAPGAPRLSLSNLGSGGPAPQRFRAASLPRAMK